MDFRDTAGDGGKEAVQELQRMSIDSQLDRMCRQKKVGFVDLWATFAGQPDLHRKDGLRMTDRGAEVLGAGLARAMGSGGAPFLNKKRGGGEIYADETGTISAKKL